MRATSVIAEDYLRSHMRGNTRGLTAELYYFDASSGVYTMVANSGIIKSYVLSDFVTDGKSITMGCVAGGKLTVDLINVSPEVVAKLSSGTKIYIVTDIDMRCAYSQRHIVDTITTKKRRNGNYDCAIVAYELSSAMTDPYAAASSELSGAQIVSQIADKYGLSVDASVTSAIALIDGDSPRMFTPLEGFDCRQTLGYIAGCYGCYARIDESERITFCWYENRGVTIAEGEIYSDGRSETDTSDRTIVMLETGTQSEQFVYPDSANGYSINFENPYINSAQAQAVYNTRIAGSLISFTPGKIRYRGSLVDNPGQIVTIANGDNTTSTFYIMRRTINYDGGVSETIECLAESDASLHFKLKSPSQQRIDRALNRMEQAIAQATDIISQTQGSVYELIPVDANDLSQGNAGWKLRSNITDNVILANSNGIGFSSNAGQSFDAAAIYIDSNGVGHINANYIDVGQIAASCVQIGTGQVSGLDGILASVDSAIANAQSTAASAQSATSQIAQICIKSGTSYINGANIYTGSVTADAIAANAITADKLNVGKGYFSNMLSNILPDALNQRVALSGYNLGLYDKTSNGIPYIQLVPQSDNIFGREDGEFVTSNHEANNNWTPIGCALGYPHPGIDYVRLTPATSGGQFGLTHKAHLFSGLRYSLSAQICVNDWSGQLSGQYPFYVKIGNSLYYSGSGLSNGGARVSGSEITIETVFDVNGESGWHDVGIVFNAMTAASVNIAWINLTPVAKSKELGFYCSNSALLTTSDNRIDLYWSAEEMNNHLSSSYGDPDTLYIALQQSKLEIGRKYVLTARIQFESSGYKSGSGAGLGYFTDRGYIPTGQVVPQQFTSNPMTVRYVFTFNGTDEDRFVNLGVYWRGLMTNANGAISARMYWMSLYEDQTAREGFYCSDANWLGSAYKTSNLLTNSNNMKDYLESSAFAVTQGANNQSADIYIRGAISSHEGNIGCLLFNNNNAAINSTSFFYLQEGSAGLSIDSANIFQSSLRLVKPESLVTDFDYLSGLAGSAYATQFGITFAPHIEITREDGAGDKSQSYYTADGIYSTDGTHYSILNPTNLYVQSVTIPSREKIKNTISKVTESVFDTFRASKIYNYHLNTDNPKSMLRTGFVIERETPDEVLADKGGGIDLYSMAAINWRATQELIERLTAIEGKLNEGGATNA